MSRLFLKFLMAGAEKFFLISLFFICLSLSALAADTAAETAAAGVESLSSAQQSCQRFEVHTPVKGSQIPDLKPQISWIGDAFSSYRLQLAVVLPEGRTLESVDLYWRGNRWVFPTPVSIPLAAVKIIVSRYCPDLGVQDLHAEPAHFFIHASQSCLLEPLSIAQNGLLLDWRSASKAERFAVTLFVLHADQTGLLKIEKYARYEVQNPPWVFPERVRHQWLLLTASGASLVASVQAQCGAVWSQAQSLSLRSPT